MIPPELRDALEPTEAEVGRLVDPLPAPLIAGLASATEPTPPELARLRPRARSRAWPLWPLVAAVAAALLLLLLPRSGTTTLAPGLEVSSGAAVAVVDQDLLIVELQDGLANLRAERPTLIRAGEVEIDVEVGTLSVLLDRGRVWVEVFEGRAEVRAGSRSTALGPGERWRQPTPLVEEPQPDALRAVRVEVEEQGRVVASVSPEALPPLRRKPWLDAPDLDPAVEPFGELLDLRERDVLRLHHVEDFLAAHPDSIFVGEARVWRLERLAAEVDPQDALDAVDAWLEAHPDSQRVAEVHYLRATVLRDRLEDCDAAAASYRVVIDLGHRPRLEEARRYLERCTD